MALEKRTIARHENFKETQVEKSMKETRLAVPEKRKIHISEASFVKGKEVEASKSSDKVEEKGIKLFVKKHPIFALHISVYTNTDIVSELKENLTPEQYKQLGNTCFGNFLQMKRCEVQHQLFRCFMALQLEGTPNNVFAMHVNGTSLHFTLREFALVTGLKCVGNDADFEFSEKVPNRLIEAYFGGANLVKKKHLMKCFADKNWGPDNDGDALKIALFKKIDAQKKYYRIAGMPLAMQVWFYEFCSDVDPKIALRVDNVVPRILNWRTTGNQPNFAYLMNDMFNDKANMDTAYICIQMHTAVYTCIQMHTDVPYICIQDTAYICIQMHTAVYSCIQMHTYAPYTCIQMHTDVAYICIQDTAYICIQMQTTIIYKDIHPTDIEFAVIQIPPKKHVASVGPSSSPPHKKRKEHEIHPSNTEYQSKIPPVCVVGEFKSLRTLINDNFKMLSDHLQHNQQNKSLRQRNEFIGRCDDGIDTAVGDNVEKIVLNDQCVESRVEGNTTLEVPCNIPPTGTSVKLTSIFEKRHPFEDDSTTGPHPILIIQEYDKWVRDGLLARHDQRSNLEDHYKKNKSTLHIPLDFGVDQHIDVIFYYLRKKGKYNQTSNFKYTTVDCIFKTRKAEIFDRYADTDSNANIAKEEDVVCEYIRGYRLLANVPWHTVDNVLIPVNLNDRLHWVLAVVSFNERYIKVYDSYISAGHDPRDSTKPAHDSDCRVHVAAYTEFLSTLGEIPQTTFDSNLLRQRYGALLWDYAMREIDVDAISENEAPSKIARQITESDSKL
ncbi:uncharacterized protein LOC142182096 [Nicotiana tabacum]|uniref:Uncharacterized protein LOC142182096 n=1 Tax=Nicotiana tabacum TaxID=4097 RepID=A0AC58URL6_TOBAC